MPIFRDENVVFDSYAADARQIDARLHSDDHSWLQGGHTTRSPHEWRLMHVEPQTMPHTMREGITMPGSIDDVTSSGVHIYS